MDENLAPLVSYLSPLGVVSNVHKRMCYGLLDLTFGVTYAILIDHNTELLLSNIALLRSLRPVHRRAKILQPIFGRIAFFITLLLVIVLLMVKCCTPDQKQCLYLHLCELIGQKPQARFNITIMKRKQKVEIKSQSRMAIDEAVPIAVAQGLVAQLHSILYVALISRSATLELPLKFNDCSLCWRAAGCSWTGYMSCNMQAMMLRLHSLESLIGFLATISLVSRTVVSFIKQLMTVEADYRMFKVRKQRGGGGGRLL